MKTRMTLLLSSLIAFNSLAAESATFSLSMDNDGLFAYDQEYTNGLFASYTTSELPSQRRLSWLSLSSHSLDKYEFVLGQKMYTPRDLSAEEPLANQRPYAGVLLGEVNYISILPQRVARTNFTLGTVGEHSLAAKAQRLVHDITDSEFPNGWDNQVEEGIVANVGYLNHLAWYRSAPSNDNQFEVANISEANLGTLRSDVSSGLMFRWGENLTSSFGSANIDNEMPFRASLLGRGKESWFAYTGAEIRYRFSDVTLEGDRPEILHPERYPITLEKLQATAVAGFAWYNENFGASLTAAIGTIEYQESQDNYHANASFSLFFFL
ncbi:exonuclease [Vibrio panuliri]|uniref:Exonuclease n=1 Tax=Vibrio panuliri TaxID=1381081 RepID=A0A1Q9HJ94_9VIBR|nr:lipid A deacylase LpxR family protein [Vibrio panuliri]OLQ90350.1 exonuclease [Vibrio panuliri]